jgi:hypothetical protein
MRTVSSLSFLVATLLLLELSAPAARAQDVPAEQPGVEGDEPTGMTPPVPDEPVGAPGEEPTPAAEPGPPSPPQPPQETDCDDRRDNDGDQMVDCADADCFDAAVCQAGGEPERTDAACSDWIDNDGDGFIDCDDDDCQRAGVSVCRGSAGTSGGGAAPAGPVPVDEDIPELGEGMTVEDLVGTHGDKSGERNDYLCSDGIDNDADGRTDCADFGCRFDPQVTVCSGTPGLRFSVVAGIGFAYDLEEEDSGQAADVRFNRIQLRTLGPIPYIQNSFFLLSMRMERSPRLTFALFQVPLGDKGHYVNVNSGSGGLSSGLIISDAKQPLLDAPFYLFNAFEQGNGASLEFGGPITPNGSLSYRVFAAGGSGEFNGNVGGRFFRADNQNFTWAAGGQIGLDIIGSYNRFDSLFLYTPAPLTLAALVGAKYDQRARERFPAFNVLGLFQYSRFLLKAENYTKYELEFGALQSAWNVTTTVLLVPKLLVFSADVGGFHAQSFDDTPTFDAALQRPIDELQFRAALHVYWYKNIGLFSVLYRENHLGENPDRPEDPTLEREILAEVQFRF